MPADVMNFLQSPQMQKVKEGVNTISANINERYKDDLFLAIRRDPKLKKILKRIKILIQYLLLFSWFFLALAVISIFFYRKKTALILIGLTSIIHIIFAPLALIGLKRQNRYLLFAFCLGNLIWLTSVTFAFFYFLLMVDPKDEGKIQFQKEIILHVGFAFYYPIGFLATFFCMNLFRLLTAQLVKSAREASAMANEARNLAEKALKLKAIAQV